MGRSGTTGENPEGFLARGISHEEHKRMFVIADGFCFDGTEIFVEKFEVLFFVTVVFVVEAVEGNFLHHVGKQKNGGKELCSRIKMQIKTQTNTFYFVKRRGHKKSKDRIQDVVA